MDYRPERSWRPWFDQRVLEARKREREPMGFRDRDDGEQES